MITHGYCADNKEAALKGFNGGVDMEMVSDCFYKNIPALLD
jgi:beta-glucosidase